MYAARCLLTCLQDCLQLDCCCPQLHLPLEHTMGALTTAAVMLLLLSHTRHTNAPIDTS